MNADYSINVAVCGGWGARDFAVSAGVVGAGGLVVQVQEVSCHGCAHPFKVGELVAILAFDNPLKKTCVYHMHCLPVEYGFAFPVLAGATT